MKWHYKDGFIISYITAYEANLKIKSFVNSKGDNVFSEIKFSPFEWADKTSRTLTPQSQMHIGTTSKTQ